MKKMFIRFSEVNSKSAETVANFMDSMKKLAELSVAHREKLSELNGKLELAKKAREEGKQDSIVEELNAINAENEAYKVACKPYNEALKVDYAIIPVGMYESYVEYMDSTNATKMLKLVDSMLTDMGVKAPSTKGVRTVCKHFSTKLGARVASASKIQKGEYTTTLSKNAFNKLFMAILADLFEENGVIGKEEKAEEPTK